MEEIHHPVSYTHLDVYKRQNFKVAGPILGPKIKNLSKELARLNAMEVVPKLEEGGSITLTLDGEEVEIKKDFVSINITAKEGFMVEMQNNLFVILDTCLLYTSRCV